MKCLICREKDAAELRPEESPDGKQFTIGLCKDCLEKTLKAAIQELENK